MSTRSKSKDKGKGKKNNLMKLNRRTLARIISYAIALVIVLVGTTVTSFSLARTYRINLEYTYQRALNDLSEYINSLNVTLEKGQYANTPKQVSGLAVKLWDDANSAKNALAQLPVSVNEVSATSKFLSQVGNFCVALSQIVNSGGTVTDEQSNTLEKLSEYAKNVSTKITQMVNDMQAGRLKLGEVKKVVKKEDANQAAADLGGGFKEMEESFAGYPTMIYDGPFSDHIMQQKPKFLAGKKQVTAAEALKVAKETTGVNDLKQTDDTVGNLPCYNFKNDTMTVSVTKAGGLLDYILDSRTMGEPTISTKQAVKKAEEALVALGLKGFTYSYYAVNNGVVVVNFAATQDGVTLYPDLIKLGIAMDNGKVVSYDAKGYIMNHTTRDFPAVKISEDKARATLSDKLKPQSHDIALVPTEGLNEVLCHEFICTGVKDEQVIVYINVETGMEEQILIIIKDENGVLAQ